MAGRPGKIERIERAQPVGPEKYVSRFYLMKAYASSDPLPRGYRKQRFLCRLYTFPTAHKYEGADPWESLQSIV